ncbi:divergent polysaccharide deacetylase family protein [Micavibrio aeruginosavorus]|uniref:divergent polysaccharide deacetylase family protein n=1 Tax=Micavibrio aeruginosavorus TaxID=349221 RepID=UPI003F4AA4B1
MKIFKVLTPLRAASIILAVVALVIVLDQLVVKRDYAPVPSHDVTEAIVAVENDLPPAPDFAPSLPLSTEPLQTVDPTVVDEEIILPEEPETVDDVVDELLAAPVHKAATNPRVVIIIDDMGVDVKRSAAVVDLPAGLTLAYLPYASNIKAQTAKAKDAGHELMVHVPMEPMSQTKDPGPEVLRVGQDIAAFDQVLQDDLSAFDGYVGINNHMGSKLTQDKAAMARVMNELKSRNLYFIDSRTIQNSVAGDMAREAGVPHAGRDVFLDHENTADFVSKSLAQVERKALKDGLAIAIGHPKDVTIEGLRAWLPTLKDKGIELVPASQVVR